MAKASTRKAAASSEPTAASMSMTKDELLKAAKKADVPVETDDNKADLVAKINTQDQFDEADAAARRAISGF